MKKLIDKTLECQENYESFFGNKSKFDYSEDFQCSIQDKYFRTGKSLMVYSKKNKKLTISFPELNVTTHFIVYFHSVLKHFSFSENVKELDFLILNKLYIKCNDNTPVKINSYMKNMADNFIIFKLCRELDWDVESFDSDNIKYSSFNSKLNLEIISKFGYINIIENEVVRLHIDKELINTLINLSEYGIVSFKNIFTNSKNINSFYVVDEYNALFSILDNKRNIVQEKDYVNLKFLAYISEIIPKRIKYVNKKYTITSDYVEYNLNKFNSEEISEVICEMIDTRNYGTFIVHFENIFIEVSKFGVIINIKCKLEDDLLSKFENLCENIIEKSNYVTVRYNNSYTIYENGKKIR